MEVCSSFWKLDISFFLCVVILFVTMHRNTELRSLQNTLLIVRLTKFLRETRASIIVQKTWRRYRCRRDFLIIRNATLKIQSYYRGMVGRCIYMEALRQHRATTLQRYIRGWQVRTWYRKTRRALVLLQSCVRRWKARKELKQLKVNRCPLVLYYLGSYFNNVIPFF